MNDTTPFKDFEIHTFFAIELMTKTFMPTGGVIKPVSTTIRKIMPVVWPAPSSDSMNLLNAQVAIDIGEQTGADSARRGALDVREYTGVDAADDEHGDHQDRPDVLDCLPALAPGGLGAGRSRFR